MRIVFYEYQTWKFISASDASASRRGIVAGRLRHRRGRRTHRSLTLRRQTVESPNQARRSSCPCTQTQLRTSHNVDIGTIRPARRIEYIIFERFHVRYHFKYVPQPLHRLGLSYQKPDTQSSKRSQKSIDHWRRHVWSRVKKSAETRASR